MFLPKAMKVVSRKMKQKKEGWLLNSKNKISLLVLKLVF